MSWERLSELVGRNVEVFIVDIFDRSWQFCWQAVNARGDGRALMRSLLAAYREPHRHYHTEQHLAECLDWLEKSAQFAENAGEVGLALWFHDAVYDVRAHDNEEKSAVLAASALKDAEVAADCVARVAGLVMATRHDCPVETADQKLIADIDLAILAAPPVRFEEYETQIRAEYSWVAEVEYCRERMRVLQTLASRASVFQSPAFDGNAERRSRENIAEAVRKLNRF